MKKLLIVILTLMCSIAFGQEKVTSITKGSKAMLFSFSGLDNLNANTFNGGMAENII